VLTSDAAHTNCLLQLIGKEWAYLAPAIRAKKGLDKIYIYFWVDFICETLYFSIQALALEYPRMVSHRSTTILNNVLLDSSSQLELSMDQQNRTSSLFLTLGAISLMKLTGLPG
ncbi:hypothetical protein EMCRGX_G019594, partial [Ephydatia muelleri]